MQQCLHSSRFLRRRNRRQDKRQRALAKLANMRAAKARKRQARIAAGWTPEPKMVRWFPLEFGVRDKTTGEAAWTDFRSVRDAARRLAVIRRYYVPGHHPRAATVNPKPKS